jgi:peptidoglycan/LPS O-acetylase OafA/YrhL
MNSPAAVRMPRVDSLTGLRWFAALSVFVFHASSDAPIPKLQVLAPAGDAGVSFFFVLSGFVLTWSWSPQVGIGTFYWRRFARIWPMLLVSSVAAFFVLHEVWAGVWKDGLLSLTLLQAWFSGGKVFGNPVAWSLSCEAFFYLLFPFVVRPVMRLRGRGLAVLAVVLLIAEYGCNYVILNDLHVSHGTHLELVRLPLYRFVEFLLGVVAATALRQGRRPKLGFHACLLLLTAVGVFTWWCGRQAWGQPGWYDQAFAPVFALMITAAASRDLEGRRSLLRTRPLVALGEWSYAFYLVHLLVVWGLRGYVHAYSHAHWDNVVTQAIWLILAIVMSAGCYVLVERPVEKRLRAMVGAKRPKVAPVVPEPVGVA